ncbi:MAG: beta-propeller fold lactonase family protein [Solirubrobacterales bacterium]|nr:beta-propeller fold lactonase family protein [Solirubrobacterales bacterium]
MFEAFRYIFRRTVKLSMACALVTLAPSASSQAASFVYATNISNDSISQYRVVRGGLAALSPAAVGTGNQQPLGLAVAPDRRNVYVASFDPAGAILQYGVGASGALTFRSTVAAPSGAGPFSLAVSPNGRSVYVTNRFGGSEPVLQYTVQRDGSLLPKSPVAVASSPGPEHVAVSPDSRSVYVTNDGGTVSQFTAAPDGSLTPKSPPTVPTGSGDEFAEPVGLAIAPDGKSVYVANSEAFLSLSGSISQFAVEPGGGLIPKVPASVPASGHPFDLVVTPNGRHVYATNPSPLGTGPGTILQYSAARDEA